VLDDRDLATLMVLGHAVFGVLEAYDWVLLRRCLGDYCLELIPVCPHEAPSAFHDVCNLDAVLKPVIRQGWTEDLPELMEVSVVLVIFTSIGLTYTSLEAFPDVANRSCVHAQRLLSLQGSDHIYSTMALYDTANVPLGSMVIKLVASLDSLKDLLLTVSFVVILDRFGFDS